MFDLGSDGSHKKQVSGSVCCRSICDILVEAEKGVEEPVFGRSEIVLSFVGTPCERGGERLLRG